MGRHPRGTILLTTLARPARIRAPALPGHVVLPEPDVPTPFSTRGGAGAGQLPAAFAGMGRPGLVGALLPRRGYFSSFPSRFRTPCSSRHSMVSLFWRAWARNMVEAGHGAVGRPRWAGGCPAGGRGSQRGGGGPRAGSVESSDGVVLGNAWIRGIETENRPWGRDWRRGGSAMPRWRGGGLAGQAETPPTFSAIQARQEVSHRNPSKRIQKL